MEKYENLIYDTVMYYVEVSQFKVVFESPIASRIIGHFFNELPSSL